MAGGLRCPLVVGWLSRPDGHPARDTVFSLLLLSSRTRCGIQVKAVKPFLSVLFRPIRVSVCLFKFPCQARDDGLMAVAARPLLVG